MRTTTGKAYAVAVVATVLPVLVAGCAGEQDPGLQPADDRTAAVHAGAHAGVHAGTGTAPASACPAGLTAADLTGVHRVGRADVDGDGASDGVVVGAVPGGGPDCAVAVLVTTAGGSSAAPVAGASKAVGTSLLTRPVFAQVDDDAGDEVVLGTSWSPRGGGEVAMFSWVGDRLVPVTTPSGRPWTLFATVDDGGGLPQLLSCTAGGFDLVQAGPGGARVTRYALAGGVLDARRSSTAPVPSGQVSAAYPDLPGAGLEVFPHCG